jgi:ribonuclease R
LTENNTEQAVLTLLNRHDYSPSDLSQLMQTLAWPPESQEELEQVLRRLEEQGRIIRTKGNRYIESREADLIPGIIRMNRQGKGFLEPDEPGLKEIVIPENATSTALHGDRVLVRREASRNTTRKDELTGSVVRILKRQRTQIVGTLQRSKQFLFVIPDDPRIPHDIYVPTPRDVGRPANIGDKVVVDLSAWESRHINPEGEIIEVLGPPDEEGVDMLSILRYYNLPLHFPKPVLQEAERIAGSGNEPGPEELTDRVDCRSHCVITIDPDDAKDFDDAICLQPHGENQWKLWVHIADVSHYVRSASLLDEEASKRGNSTYLVDRVIPMLPEALSNELCSLKPNVDRLTKCVEFVLTNDGKVLQTKFYPAVIRSQRRFTYKQVLALLQAQPSDDPIEQMVHEAHALAQKIRGARFKAGSLELDFPESKIRLDDHGRVLFIEKIENDVSHQLIEEYMLLANEAVASRLMALRRPAVYRVHEAPNAMRLQEYRQDVLSHKIPCGDLTQRPEVQKLLFRLKTAPVGSALKIGFLKSLMRARYAIEPLGHYGLHKSKYTHFTSPIRRYADLLVHRALFDAKPIPIGVLKIAAANISVTERNSSDAERDSKEIKLFAYLKEQLKSGEPQKYSALVIDVRNFGFFVDVSELGLSGLVHLSSVEDDFYVFEPERNHLIGRRTRRIIRLGDKITVQVYKVDSFKKQVDFRLVTERPTRTHGQQPRRDQPFRQDQQRQPFRLNHRPKQSQQPRQGSQPRQASQPRQGPQPRQVQQPKQGPQPRQVSQPRQGPQPRQAQQPKQRQSSRPKQQRHRGRRD